MSENWRYELSLKGGEPMINVRADTIEDFVEALSKLEEHKEPITLAIAQFAPPRPERPAPAPTPRQAPNVSQGGAEREIGPLVLDNVEIKRSSKDGVVWKSPMFIVKWADGSASTFDQLVGKAAQGFWTNGAQCYLTVEPSPKNPKYMNVVSIRSAVVS